MNLPLSPLIAFWSGFAISAWRPRSWTRFSDWKTAYNSAIWGKAIGLWVLSLRPLRLGVMLLRSWARASRQGAEIAKEEQEKWQAAHRGVLVYPGGSIFLTCWFATDWETGWREFSNTSICDREFRFDIWYLKFDISDIITKWLYIYMLINNTCITPPNRLES